MCETFTTTELRTESAKVYNSVNVSGQAFIIHRDRPDMILMTHKHFEEAIEKAKK